MPFDLPQGWAWTRLGDFSFITKLAGFEYSKNIAKVLVNSGIPLVKGKNIQGSNLIEVFEDYIPNEMSVALPRSRITRRCLLLPYVGTIGNVAVFDKDYVAHLGSNVAKIEFDIDCGIEEEYVALILRSPTGYKLLTRDKKATAQDSLSMAALRNVIIPIPSSDEQKRIVAKVKELFAYSDTIGEASDDIAKTAGRIDKKLLDLAIRGQLVPQDSNDEPASELVKRIEATRKSKLGGKKSHTSASDRPAYEIDPPFDIPDSWEWIKLGSLIQIIAGVSYQKDDVTTTGVRILRGGNIKEDARLYLHDDDVFLPASYADDETSVQAGDIVVVASTGSSTVIGRPAIATKTMPAVQIGAFLRIIRAVDCDVKSWLPVLFLGDYYRNHIRSKSKGTNIKNLKAEYLTELPVPLPPLAEQKRIVAKIEELRAMTRTLTT